MPAETMDPAADRVPSGVPGPTALARMPLPLVAPLVTVLVTALVGAAIAMHYARLGLTLSHYDAKAHLVVARRILDSLTPGWEQVGAVWLPLPHLLNMLPVQHDWLYRTGLSATLLSIACHAVTAGSLAFIVQTLTASRVAAILAAALFALNPNTLYLQSTPMTEPLLFALTTLQVALLVRWLHAGDALVVPALAGWVSALACLTRYEAWPVTAALIISAAFGHWRRRHAAPRALLLVHARLAAYPVMAVLLFLAFSRITVGEWFVSGGFFVVDETLNQQPVAVLRAIYTGLSDVAGTWLSRAALLSLPVVVAVALGSRQRAAWLLPVSLAAAVALPAAAYFAGHPFRVRYEIPLIVAGAALCGLAVSLLGRATPPAAILLLTLAVSEMPPLHSDAAMLREARLDRYTAARATVTRCLRDRYRGGGIMMSMGALGHYMHETASDGFAIRDFLHEGNGVLWDSAFTRGPASLVEWVIVEEAAEGGDAVIQRHRLHPALLRDYDRVCSGGNITLYQRNKTVAE